MKVVFLVISCLTAIALAHPPFVPYKLEFLLSARNLPNTDANKNAGPPEAYAVVSHVDYRLLHSDVISEVGSTNYTKNKRNPDWRELFRVTVTGGWSMQYIKVAVYDSDYPAKKSDDLIGTAEFRLNDLIHANKDHQLSTPLKLNGKAAGTLVVKGREYGSTDKNLDQRFFHPTRTILYPKTKKN